MNENMNGFEQPEVTIDEPIVPREKDKLDGYIEKYREYDSNTVDKLNLHHIKDLQEKHDNGQIDLDLSRDDIANAFKELEDTTEIPSDEVNQKQAGVMSRTIYAGMRDAALSVNELLPEIPYLKDIGIGGGVIGKTKEQVSEKIDKKLGPDAAHPEGLLEDIAKTITQFNAAFIPTYKLVSKGIKNPVYAGVVSGTISGFLAFKGSDGSMVDLGKEFPGVYKHLPDFIKGKLGESELKARLRNTFISDVFGAAQGKVINAVTKRFNLVKNKKQTDEAVIHFQKRKDAREEYYDKALKNSEERSAPPIDRQNPMTDAEMLKLSEQSNLTKEQLLQNKIPEHGNISKTKYGFIGDKVKGVNIRHEAFNEFSSAIPEYRALLKNGVDGTADNILDEVSKLKELDEAVKNLADFPETMSYASRTRSTGIINTMVDKWQKFETRDKDMIANLMLDIAELKDPEALKSFTDGFVKTSPELFRQVFKDHAMYSMLSGTSTHSIAGISNSVIDPFIWSPLQKTVASGLSTVRDVISTYNISNKIKSLSKEDVSSLSTKIKNRDFLESYIGRGLTKEEAKAFSVGKLKLEEVAESHLKLPANVKSDFVHEIANQKINQGVIGYFTETPGKDTYLKEALIGLKSEASSIFDILSHTAKTMAQPSEYNYSPKGLIKNPGEMLKAGVKDVVAKATRLFLDDETLKHVDNMEGIAAKASTMRIDRGVQTEGASSGTLGILKHKLLLDPKFGDSLVYKLAQGTSWMRRNTIDPHAILSTLDDIGSGAAQHSIIKQEAYAKSMREGLKGGDSAARQSEIIAESLRRADGDFMFAADDFIRSIQEKAIKKGQERTFTTPLEEGLTKTLLYDAQNQLDNMFSAYNPIPLGSIMMMFKKTPINMMTWAYNKMPVYSLSNKFRDTLKYGTGREKDELMANWVLGSAVMVGTHALGLDKKIIGSAFDKKQADFHTSLHEPIGNAIKIGDTAFSLQKLQPYSTLLTLPATLSQLWRMHPEHTDDAEVNDLSSQVIKVGVLAIGNFVSDMNNMRGIGELLKAVSTGKTEGVQNILEGFAANMLVPNFIQQFAKHAHEHVQVTDSLIDKIKIRLGMGTVDKTTFFGEPLSKPKEIVPGFLPFEYYPLYEEDNNSTVKKILAGSVAAAYPLISPRNIHDSKSMYKYTPQQYQKMIDILNDGKYMPSNIEHYSALMLDKNGEYNSNFLQLLVNDQEGVKSDENTFNRVYLQNLLQSVNRDRISQAKYILQNTDAELRSNLADATEKRFVKNISPDRNLQNIVGPVNVK